jgi:hypothetical protein
LLLPAAALDLAGRLVSAAADVRASFDRATDGETWSGDQS